MASRSSTKPPRLIHVEWDDAAHVTGPASASELNPDYRYKLHTAGYLVARSSKSIVVAQDYHDHESGERNWRDIDHIPAGMVIRTKTFRID